MVKHNTVVTYLFSPPPVWDASTYIHHSCSPSQISWAATEDGMRAPWWKTQDWAERVKPRKDSLETWETVMKFQETL